MGWLRNVLVFPGRVWEEAAGKLRGEFVKGKWLSNSEIRLSHRGISIKLVVQFSITSDDHTQFTRVLPDVLLHPNIRLMLCPEMRGIMGSLTSGLIASAGKSIKVPGLGEDYLVIGDNNKIANDLFGNPGLVSKLKSLPVAPTVAIGGSLGSWTKESKEDDEEVLSISVPRVVKDIHHLVTLVDFTKILLDLLEENGCLT